MQVRKLMSLGYLASLTKEEQKKESLADPKDKIHLHRLQLKAMALISKGMGAKAFEAVEPVLQEEPDNRQAFDNLVRLAMEYAGKLPQDKVIPLLRRGMVNDPDVNNAVALGMVYESSEDYPAALTAFNKAVELDGNDLAALNNSAYYLYKLDGDLSLAQQRAEKVVQLIDAREELKGTPPAGRARHTLACILLKQNKAQEAIPYLQDATKFVPNYAAAFYQLGVARQYIGETEKAVKLIEHAVKLAGNTNPDWLPDAKSRLSQIDR